MMSNPTNEQELREQLAAIEHERWADWQRYVHSVCYENKGIGGEPTGELIIPSELARGWERQIGTPYADLTELEKQSDREQVDRYWHLIQAHTNAEIARTLDRLESEVQGIATSKPTVDYATSIPTNKVLYTIQAERAKLKEMK